MKLKKESIIKKNIKNNSSQPGLTNQTYDQSLEMKIISYKTNLNKSQSLILIQSKIPLFFRVFYFFLIKQSLTRFEASCEFLKHASI
jgi:hypothetical protein